MGINARTFRRRCTALGLGPPDAGRAARASKYHNERFEIDGITFDSKREARVWCDLHHRAAGDPRHVDSAAKSRSTCPAAWSTSPTSWSSGPTAAAQGALSIAVLDAKGVRTEDTGSSVWSRPSIPLKIEEV